MRENPIALFDSGSGGLAVLRHLERRLPHESILYLGDLAHFPYGEKPAPLIEKYCLSNGHFLENLGAKLLIVACNTASAIGLESLRKSLKIPVIGLIEPCVNRLLTQSKGRIGILATQAAIKSKSYEKAILEKLPSAQIFPKASPHLAYLIQENLTDHPATPFVVKASIDPFLKKGVDSLVLGCSHYPLILPHLLKALGDEIQIVDSSLCCIDEVCERLKAEDLLNPTSKKKFERFFISGFTHSLGASFQNIAPQFLGRSISFPESSSP